MTFCWLTPDSVPVATLIDGVRMSNCATSWWASCSTTFQCISGPLLYGSV